MKICRDCGACKKLYRRPGFTFFKTKLCYCIDREEITEADGRCDNWRRKKIVNGVSEKRFDEAIADIRVLLDILK